MRVQGGEEEEQGGGGEGKGGGECCGSPNASGVWLHDPFKYTLRFLIDQWQLD